MLHSYISDLKSIDDQLERYEYLMELADNLAPIEASLKNNNNIVEGCVSKVWIVADKVENNYFFSGDSKSMIIKGLLVILFDIVNKLSIEEVADFDTKIFNDLGLDKFLTPSRINGFYAIINRIKYLASQ